MGCVESIIKSDTPTYFSNLRSKKDGIVSMSYRKKMEKIDNKMQQPTDNSKNSHYKNNQNNSVTNVDIVINGDRNNFTLTDNGYLIKNKNNKDKEKNNDLFNSNSDVALGERILEFTSTLSHNKGQYNISYFPQWGLYKMCHTCSLSQHHETNPVTPAMDHCFYHGAGKFGSQRSGSCGIHHSSSVANNQRYLGDYCQGSSFVGYDCGCRLTNILAMNALDLTAPASDALLKNRKNAWVQLAGHPGSFAPAGPHTIWKKRLSKENTETIVYQQLMNDIVKDLVPKFYREVEYNGDFFIEMQDLIQDFSDPNILDIKLGTRTFQESEVKNPVLRKDLYEKMVKLNVNEPTAEEHEQKAITKLRYMQFREKGSSTATLGFRCEAIRMSGQQPITSLQKVKSRPEVQRTLATFLKGNEEVKVTIIKRLKDIRRKLEASQFFKNHEVIGSSLLFLYDKDNKAGVWMIDFAKTILVEGATALNHRSAWQVGNHEDGFLFGIDQLIDVFEELDLAKTASLDQQPVDNHLVNNLHTTTATTTITSSITKTNETSDEPQQTTSSQENGTTIAKHTDAHCNSTDNVVDMQKYSTATHLETTPTEVVKQKSQVVNG